MRIKSEAAKRLGAPRKPTPEQVRRLLSAYSIELNEEETQQITAGISVLMDQLTLIDELQEAPEEFDYGHRNRGYCPGEDEDPLNIFITKCSVKGAPVGKLAGKRVAVKDNISVAGIPCTNASQLLANFFPSDDATVIKRLLAEGAEIIGKTNMACFSTESTSETSEFGIVRNPHNRAYSAGGSSSGSAAAIASGDADISLGVDQGGSARLPASWCGCVSIMPTRGLVPTYGVVSVSPTMDFVCPIARTVKDVALTLEVIAGADGISPNQACYCSPAKLEIPKENYTEALGQSVSGLRIGLIRESMEWEECEEDVVSEVRHALNRFANLGASCSEVSVPTLRHAPALHRAILVTEWSLMMEGAGGFMRLARYDTTWAAMFEKIFKGQPNQLPLTLKGRLAAGAYLRREYYSRYYARAQNLRRAMEQEYERLFREFDILVTPTVPFKAVKFGASTQMEPSTLVLTLGAIRNLCPFNLTGLPALSICCGVGENNLPIGLQLVGRYFEESTLLRAADEFEKVFSPWS